MSLNTQTEWMKIQQHASVMQPGKAFRAIQSPEGASIIFSISTDDTLYAYREDTGKGATWDSQNLLEGLPATCRKAKMFTVVQTLATLVFDLVVVVKDNGGQDRLFACLGQSSKVTDWRNPWVWKEMPFDGPKEEGRGALDISFIDILPSPTGDISDQVCIVDIRRKPDDAMKLLDRFYLQLEKAPYWQRHALPIDLQQGTIKTVAGCRPHDRGPGVYTMGRMQDIDQLIYAPLYHPFDRGIPPSPARLFLPKGATAMTTSLNPKNRTTLYVSSESGIVVFAPDQQRDGAQATLIVADDLAIRSHTLAAQTAGGRTALWGIGFNGALWYTHCTAGQETTRSAWAPVVPLLPSVENFSFYTSKSTGRLTLFAHPRDAQLISLIQDPVTLAWNQRQTLLPSPAIEAMIEIDVFNTRLTATDKSGQPLVGVELEIKAVSTVAVFVNGASRLLRADTPLKVRTNEKGAVTIAQKAGDMNAVVYNIKLAEKGIEGGGSTSTIDPSKPGMDRLAQIDTMEKLEAMMVTDPITQKKEPFVPRDTSKEDKQAMLDSLKEFCKLSKELPKDGRRAVASGEPSADTSSLVQQAGASQAVVLSASDLFATIRNGLKSAYDYAVTFVKGVWRFVCKIGGAIYHAVLDCLAAIKDAIRWVFDKVKVGINKVVNALSFLFNWRDIKRTKDVLKNMFMTYGRHQVDQLPVLAERLDGYVAELDEKVRKMTGLSLPSNATKMKDPGKGKNQDALESPQSQQSVDDFKSQVGNTKPAGKTDVEAEPKKKGILKQALDILMDALRKAGDILKLVADSLYVDIIRPFTELTATEIITRFIGIIARFGIQTAGLVLSKVLAVMQIIGNSLLDLLEEKIKIPIFSALYKKVSGSELSWIDLVCLVIAIPVTVAVKATIGETPFPDNETTNQLKSASNWTEFSGILANRPKTSTNAVANSSKPDWLVKWMASKERIRIISALNIASDIAATCLGIASLIPAVEPLGEAIAMIKACLFGVYIGPNVLASWEGFQVGKETWIYQVDGAICTILLLKTIAEPKLGQPASGIIDVLGSLIWLTVPIGRIVALKDTPSGIEATDWIFLGATVAHSLGRISCGIADVMAAKPPAAEGGQADQAADTKGVKGDGSSGTTATKAVKGGKDEKEDGKKSDLAEMVDTFKEKLEDQVEDGDKDAPGVEGDIFNVKDEALELMKQGSTLDFDLADAEAPDQPATTETTAASSAGGAVAGMKIKLVGCVLIGVGSVANVVGTAIAYDRATSEGGKYDPYRRP